MTAETLCAELKELYKNRYAIDVIAEDHNCTYTDIILLIGATPEFNRFCAKHNKYNQAITDELPKTRNIINWSEMTEPLLQMYHEGIDPIVIAETLNIGKTTVLKCLNRNGIYGRRDLKVRDEWKPDIIKKYKSGESISSIARWYGINGGSIKHFLKGVER